MFINHCPFCNSPVNSPASLCPSCMKTAEAEKFDSFAVRCPVCARPLVAALYECSSCREGRSHRVYSIFDYRAPFFRHILEQWKFEGRRDYTPLIAEQFLSALQRSYPSLQDIVIVPVPCSAESLKKRKWDQMKDIALYLRRKHGIECSFLIENARKGGTQQKTLDRRDRINASEGKYAINRKKALKANSSGTLVIIDDITTTGSTIRSCISLLNENGFKKVQAVTLMAEL